MKVLLRESLEWVDATIDTGSGRICLSGSKARVYDTDILSIKDGEFKKYVICSKCGNVIRNTAAKKNEHMTRYETSKNCLNCSQMKRTNMSLQNHKFVLNKDGTYTEVSKSVCKLVCSNNYYRTYDINSEEARNACKYRKCADATFTALRSSIFAEFPGLFDTIATVDALNRKKWYFRWHSSDGKYMHYQLRSRRKIVALVNGKIIDSFEFTYNRVSYRFFYSEKYDKILFYSSSGKYDPTRYGLSEGIVEELKEIVRKIYKEAK